MSVLMNYNGFYGDVEVFSGSKYIASFTDVYIKEMSQNHFIVETPNKNVHFFNATVKITERKVENTSNDEITV